MKKVEIEWHPYPQEKPPEKEKKYLVTLKKEYKSGVELEVHERLYGSCGGFESPPNGRIYILNNVIAWAYPPKPYRKDE